MTSAPTAPRPVTPASILAASWSGSAGSTATDGGRDDRGRTARGRASWPAGWTRTWSGARRPESPALAALADARARPTGARALGDRPAGAGDALRPRRGPGCWRCWCTSAGARRVLEIGMFTGYSALAMAEALPADGTRGGVRDRRRRRAFAQRLFRRVRRAAQDRHPGGPRARTPCAGSRRERFDLIFIDADKAGYLEYLNTVLDSWAARAARPGLRGQHPDAGAALDGGRADRERRRDRTRSTGPSPPTPASSR